MSPVAALDNSNFNTFERMKQIIVEGSQMTDIPAFYKEINRVFMSEEDWTLGPSLDAFNDLLYGGYGILQEDPQVTLVWKDYQKSKEALGYLETQKYYQAKLAPGSPFDKARFQQQLKDLNAGVGKTYFDLLMEIIKAHPNIRLVRA